VYKTACCSLLNIWKFDKNFEKKCNKWRGWVHILVDIRIGTKCWLPAVWRRVELTFYQRRDVLKLGHGQRAFACASGRVGLDRFRKLSEP
jgi:hypothetical protein